jgi:hypothetical protein
MHSGLRADSCVEVGRERAYDPKAVVDPFRSRRHRPGDLCNGRISRV